MKTYKNGKLMENVYIKGIKANGLIKNGVTFFKIGDEPSGDITPPVYTTLRIMGGIRNAADNTYYANSTHNVTIYVNFGEKLYIKPKVKIGNKEWELSSEAVSGNGYMYYKPIPASLLENGLVNFEVYGYADEAGNVGRTLTNTDITLSSQSRVIVDKVAPTLTIKTSANDTIGDFETNSFTKVSFKLHDNIALKEYSLNGTITNVSGTWSDFNGITKSTKGAVVGTNNLTLKDLAGNETTSEFTLE